MKTKTRIKFEDVREQFVAFWQSGVPGTEIAEKFGKSQSWVSKHVAKLRREGVDLEQRRSKAGERRARHYAPKPMIEAVKDGKHRNCMSCGVKFLSPHNGVRSCDRCRNNEDHAVYAASVRGVGQGVFGLQVIDLGVR